MYNFKVKKSSGGENDPILARILPSLHHFHLGGEAGRRGGSLKRLDQQLFAMLYLFSRVVPGLELFPLLLDDTES